MDIRQARMVLRTRNFENTCRFYGETLALPRLSSWNRQDGRGASFQAGPAVVEVRGQTTESTTLRNEAYDYQGPAHKITLSFVVPSAQEAYETLLFRDQNIPGGLRQEVDGTLLFETHDPDGVKIVFQQASL